MGFCLFNNVAIAAALRDLRAGPKRVFILDWDVHHGNGTAETFRRPDILFASIHQSGIYPGTGAERCRFGPRRGLHDQPSRTGRLRRGLWLSLLEHIVLPAARAPSSPPRADLGRL